MRTQGVHGKLKIFKEIKLRRDSTFHKRRQGLRDRLIGGEKVETFEQRQILLSQRKLEAQEEE
jgi:hypothetical protein